MNQLRTWSIAASIVVLMATPTHAQFRLNIEQTALYAYAEEVDSERELTHEAGDAPALIRNLDQMIFNQHRTAGNARKHFQNELRKWLDLTDAGLELTADERAKLWLAGSSDINSFFGEADEINDILARGNQAEVMNVLWEKLQNVQQKMRKGVCSEGSMLAKVTKHMFDKDRRARSSTRSLERRKFAHAATVKLVVSEIEKTMPLTTQQRDGIIEILVKQDPEKLVDHRTYYENALVLMNYKKIRDLLGPAQQRRLRDAIENAKKRDEFQMRAQLEVLR